MSLLNGGLKLSALLHKVLTINQAKQIHAILLVGDLSHLEPVLIRQLILSAGSYSLRTNKYVNSLLHHMQYPDVTPLAYAIRCLSQQGQFEDVIDLYVQLQRVGVHPNTFALSSTLKACGKLHRCKLGVSVHAQVYKYGLSKVVFVETAVMDFYCKVGDVKKAHKLFDNMDGKNVVSWNSILAGYVKDGNLPMAQSVFDEMPEKDIISWNSMVSGYARVGIMDQAYALFQQMPQRNSASWNSMIGGYIESGKIELARSFFEAMPVKSQVSFITMISGYSKNGSVSSAKEIFDLVEEKNVILYNAMIACYAQNGWAKEALNLFDEMLQQRGHNIRPDKMTLASVLSLVLN